MITDDLVFDEEFVPRDIKHRNAEGNELSRALEPIQEDRPPEKVAFVFGPSGSGKTCVTKYILRKFGEEIPRMDTRYINCWDHFSRFSILQEVLSGFSTTADIHRQSTPTDELLRQVKGYEGDGYAVVLDEVDQLDDYKILYDLYGVQNLSIILIANEEEEFFGGLDDRTNSRFRNGRRIYMEKYSIDALTDILADRAKAGLAGDSVSRAELEFIADVAAGDARQGIQNLYQAAREAETKGEDEITPELVREVAPDVEEAIRRSNESRLREHQQVVLNILKDHGEMEPGELYNLYENRVDNPKTNRTVRNYLQKMAHYDLVIAEGEKRARTYRAQESAD
jgi:Cdc6-like AAA superfamily ATPase